MSGRITFGALAVVIHDGAVLLVRRRDFPVWVAPGGGLEFGESPDQAAAREALEESGIEIVIDRFVGVYSRQSAQESLDHQYVYLAHPSGGELRRSTDETTDAGFFAPGALPRETLWWHRMRIADAVAGWTGRTVFQMSGNPFGKSTREDIAAAIRAGECDGQRVLEQLIVMPPDGVEHVRMAGIRVVRAAA